MRSVILVVLLLSFVAMIAAAMPHDHTSNNSPAHTVRRVKSLLGRLERGHHAHKSLATSDLRVAAKNVNVGAPVTFESFSTDQTCGSTPVLSLKLNVGQCHVVCPGFAVNITDFVQPPTDPNDAVDLCASMSHYTQDNCAGDQASMSYQCKTCQAGQFWADCGGVFGALFMHTGCTTPSVTAPTCSGCNASTITTFGQCKDVPLMGSVKAIKLEKCSTARLNLLHSCDSPSEIYESYSLSQGQCMAGMLVKAGH